MAVPSYTTNLVDINLGKPTWVELTGAAKGGAPVAEADYFIEGSGCISETTTVVGTSGNVASMAVDLGAPVTISSGEASFHWIYFGAPNALANLNSGGYRIVIGGSGIVNYKMWYVLGSETYTYGGWQNIVVDPLIEANQIAGVSTAGAQVFGSVVNIANAVAKGNPYGNDAIRYGRTLQVTGGQSGDYATFAGTATTNDLNPPAGGNRWGLFQAVTGGYLQKGRFLIGISGTAVDFRDSDRNISIQDTTKVGDSFNEFEVRNSSSRVDWTGILITALGTTSKGKFTTTDDADINFDTCTFTDMNTFNFMPNATVIATTFRRCGIVTQNSGAVFTNCKFDKSTATKALIIGGIASITDTEFISDGTGYALEGFNNAGDYSLINLTFTGYAVGNGSTGNEAIHVLATSGTVNLGRSGGTIPSIHTEGATVNITISITLTITVVGEDTLPIELAQVAIYRNSDWAQLMNEDTNASGVATENYVGAGGGITIRVRKSSPGLTRYIPITTSGTLEASNFSATIVLTQDTVA